MDSYKAWVLLNGLTSYFLSIALLYQMSPFFLNYAMDTAGATPSEVGLIFAVLPGTSFLLALPASEYIVKFGCKKMLALGLLGVAGSSLMFGLSASVPCWLLWRALQGASAAFINGSISCMFAKAFPGPREFAYVNGLQKAVANMGFVVAPTLGGFLFDLGGFFLPFALSAGCHLAFVVLSCIAPDRQAKSAMQEPLLVHETPQHVGLREILYRDVLLLVPAGILVPAFWGAFDPLIANHLRSTLGISQTRTIGSIMALSAYPSVALNVIVPVLMTRLRPDTICLMGMLIFVWVEVGLAWTDPDSASNLGLRMFPEPASPGQWTWQISFFLALGVSAAFVWGPTLPDIMEKAATHISAQRCLTHEAAVEAVSPAVSAVFNGGAAIGEASGPILGGILYSSFGFSGTFLGMAVVFFAYCCMLVAYRFREMVTLRQQNQKIASIDPLPEVTFRQAVAFLDDMTSNSLWIPVTGP